MLTRAMSSTKINAMAYFFRLYVAGESPNSVLALRNLKSICKKYCGNDYQIDVVDVLLSPERAWRDGVMVTPMVIRISPGNTVQIIGNLSNIDQVLNTLNLTLENPFPS